MQFDIPSWATQVVTLVGAGGGSVVAVKLIEKFFSRDDREAADRVSVSSELRQDVRDLKADLERVEERLEVARQRENTLFAQCAELRAENRALRGRYHELRGVLQLMASTNELYHRQLGLPEHDLPRLPGWVYQPVDGPTARDVTPKPSEEGDE
jgi:predicted nuclease with TOPRIM domain